MTEKQENWCISLPGSRSTKAYAILGILFLIFPLLLTWGEAGAIAEDIRAGEYTGLFLIVLFDAACVLPFVGLILWGQMRVHFVPQGIAMTVLGRTVRQFPVEKIKYVYKVIWLQRNFRVMQWVLCPYSIEEIAALREAELKKGAFTKHEVHFRKRNPKWQEIFAEEYLLRYVKSVRKGSKRKEFLLLPGSPQTDAVIRLWYPQLSLVAKEKMDTLTQTTWKDPDPLHVSRGYVKQRSQNAAEVICLLFLMLPLGIFFFLPGTEALEVLLYGVPLLLIWLGMFGFLLILARKEGEIFCFAADGITIGNKKKMLPASQIHAIVKTKDAYSNTAATVLAILQVPPEKILEDACKKMERTAHGRMCLSGWRQIPDWERRLLLDHCAQISSLYGLGQDQMQVLRHTPQREETLRQLYPQVRWIEYEVM